MSDYDKTIIIPIRISNGEVKYYYGGNLPEIEDGVIGDLILPEYSVKDNRFINISQKKDKIEILPSGSLIMVAVSSKNIPQDMISFIIKINTSLLTSEVFVEVELKGPLYLLIRGSKKSSLLGVNCFIPSLKKQAISINNAYTIISEAFEPDRHSHTGNVFEKCFYNNNDTWYPLEHLRAIEEGKFEERLFLDYKIFELNRGIENNVKLSNAEELLVKYLHEFGEVYGEKIKQLYNCNKNKYIAVINSLTDKEVIIERKE